MRSAQSNRELLQAHDALADLRRIAPCRVAWRPWRGAECCRNRIRRVRPFVTVYASLLDRLAADCEERRFAVDLAGRTSGGAGRNGDVVLPEAFSAATPDAFT